MGEEVAYWRPDGFFEDRYAVIGAEDALSEAGPILVSLERWKEVRTRNTLDAWQMGVSLKAGEAVEEIESDLERIELIALDFPAFNDGRSFSAARLLRERYGYRGELRATGDVLLDQIPFMLRCGFESFAISHGPTRRALSEGRLPRMPVYMQPVGDDGEAVPGTRPWLRRRA